MRKAIVVVVLLCAGCPFAAQKSAKKTDEKDFKPLSERYLKALRSGKVEEAVACWLSAEQIQELRKHPHGLTGMDIDRLEMDQRGLPEHVRTVLEKTLAELKAMDIDAGTLEYVKSEGKVTTRGQLQTTGRVRMLFKAPDGTVLTQDVDDALKLEGKWYFQDRPEQPRITKPTP